MTKPAGPHLRRVCSYCGQGYGWTPCVPKMDGQESHGCCPKCEPRMRREMGLPPEPEEEA